MLNLYEQELNPISRAFNFDSLNLEDLNLTSKQPKNRSFSIDDLNSSDKNNLGILDTCTEHTASLCKLPGGRGGKFKPPTLTELHNHLFNTGFGEAHNATADVEATTRCFLELIRLRQYTKEQLDVPADYFDRFSEVNPMPIKVIGLNHLNLKRESEKIRNRIEKEKGATATTNTSESLAELKDATFAHLHNHTQYSVLQSTIQIGNIVKAAAKDNMSAVAMTDTGNMMAAFHFVEAVIKQNKAIESANKEAIENGEEPTLQPLKPIVGCEFNICEDHTNKSQKDNGYQVVYVS